MTCEPIINRITWDRIWISFFIRPVPADCDVMIRGIHTNSRFILKKGDAPDEYRLNITNPGNREMLPPDIYLLYIKKDEGLNNNSSDNTNLRINSPDNCFHNKDINPDNCFYHNKDINPDKCFHYNKELYLENCSLEHVQSLNRQFVYYHSERAYRVQFTNKNGFKIKTSDITLPGLGLPKRIGSFIRRSRNDLAKAILRSIYNIEYIFLHRRDVTDVHSLKSPRILLMSDQSEEMGSNMAAFKNALIREGYKPDELLRAITTKHYSLLHWIKSLSKIASSDFIFLDDHSQTTDWLTIKGAVITQLWHSGAGFKSTGYSRFGMPASPAPKSGHRQYKYGIAGSKKIRHFFSEVWGINDEDVLPTGMPRLDEYLDEEYRKKTVERLFKDYPMLCKPRVILFAPTYRGENKRNASYPYAMLDIKRLYELCQSTDSFIIFKMHPYVTEPVPIPEKYKDRMLDLTSYPNINDLFYITDLLITDYSSSIYEFSLMHKPMLFYAFDIDTYTKERGFHRDYRKNVPGKIVETFDDMINAIRDNDFEEEKVTEYIDNNFEHVDTNACSRIIDWIIRGNLPENQSF